MRFLKLKQERKQNYEIINNSMKMSPTHGKMFMLRDLKEQFSSK